MLDFLIAAGRRSIALMEDGSIFQRTYVDDRRWASPAARSLISRAQAWMQWSDHVGMRENPNKTAVIMPKNVSDHDRASLIELFGEKAIVDSTVVLGCVIRGPNHEFALHDKEITRYLDGLRVISAIASLRFLSFKQATDMPRMYAVSKLSYGWVSRQLDARRRDLFWSACLRAARRFRSCPKNFIAALVGATLHPEPVLAARAYGIIVKERFRAQAEERPPRQFRLMGHLKQFIRNCGGRVDPAHRDAKWIFPQLVFVIDDSAPKQKHALRQAWRLSQLGKFEHSQRREIRNAPSSSTFRRSRCLIVHVHCFCRRARPLRYAFCFVAVYDVENRCTGRVVARRVGRLPLVRPPRQ